MREGTLFSSMPLHSRYVEGQSSYPHASQAHSHVFLWNGSALLCCPGEMQGLISLVLTMVGDTVNSPTHVTLGPAFLPATGGEL